MSTSHVAAFTTVPVQESRRRAAPFIPFVRISARTGIWSILLGISLITLSAVGLALLHLPTLDVSAAHQHWTDYTLRPGALFFKAVIIYPLIEELFYRGLVLQFLRRYSPPWFAIGLSAAFFGATHVAQGFAGMANAFLLGCVFSWLTMRARSLLPSMLCHAAVNFSWLFLILPGFGIVERTLALDPRAAPMPLDPLTVFPAWWLATSFVLAITAVVMLRRSTFRPDSV